MSIEYFGHGQLAGVGPGEIAGELLDTIEPSHNLNTALILGNLSLPQASGNGEGGGGGNGGETDQERRRRELEERNREQNKVSEANARGRGIRGPGEG